MSLIDTIRTMADRAISILIGLPILDVKLIVLRGDICTLWRNILNNVHAHKTNFPSSLTKKLCFPGICGLYVPTGGIPVSCFDCGLLVYRPIAETGIWDFWNSMDGRYVAGPRSVSISFCSSKNSWYSYDFWTWRVLNAIPPLSSGWEKFSRTNSRS